MDREGVYYKQVQLLVRLLPLIAEEPCFALKGGTAINLFVRDLPRLSVDIDLVFLPTAEREQALKQITEALSRIALRIKEVLRNARVMEQFREKSDALRLIISHQDVQVKIELSPVLRGTVFKPRTLGVCDKVEERFGYAEIAVVDLADLYAGKICAALDRQHPRDLFDIKVLLEKEGLTHTIRQALVIYLISHSRPVVELLNPVRKDIRSLYEGEFTNMVDELPAVAELEQSRETIIRLIHAELTDNERYFLLSFKNREPDWTLLDVNNVSNLPAVQWKMMNLKKMSAEKHRAAYEKLEHCLFSANTMGRL
jgi:predicted nucleotidyltransferase component of viral defense system